MKKILFLILTFLTFSNWITAQYVFSYDFDTMNPCCINISVYSATDPPNDSSWYLEIPETGDIYDYNSHGNDFSHCVLENGNVTLNLYQYQLISQPATLVENPTMSVTGCNCCEEPNIDDVTITHSSNGVSHGLEICIPELECAGGVNPDYYNLMYKFAEDPEWSNTTGVPNNCQNLLVEPCQTYEFKIGGWISGCESVVFSDPFYFEVPCPNCSVCDLSVQPPNVGTQGNLAVFFETGSSHNASVCSNLEKYWDYGDGSVGDNLGHHAYSAAGFYTVCVTASVTGPAGELCEETACNEIEVENICTGCNCRQLAPTDRMALSSLSTLINTELDNNFIKGQKAFISHQKEIMDLLESDRKVNRLFKDIKSAGYELLINSLVYGKEITVEEKHYYLINELLNSLKYASKSNDLKKSIEEAQMYLPVIQDKEVKEAIIAFDKAKITAKKMDENVGAISYVKLLNNLSNNTTLLFQSEKTEGDLSIGIYDMNGRLVSQIVDCETILGGYYQYEIDKTKLLSGIYMIKVQYETNSGNYQESIKLPVSK